MRFYTETHKHYCGIDLHARTMYVCILDREGQVLLHRSLPCDPERFLRAIAPYRQDLVVAVECIFTWYWLADLCAREGIAFVLGHALYMRAIHGAKAKNDKIDSKKTAALLKGGLLPQAYVYPPEMRATRDLLERNHVDRWHSRHRNRWVSTRLKPALRGWLGQKGYKNGRMQPLRASCTATSMPTRQIPSAVGARFPWLLNDQDI